MNDVVCKYKDLIMDSVNPPIVIVKIMQSMQ